MTSSTIDAEAESIVLAGILMGRDNSRLSRDYFGNAYSRQVFELLRELQAEGMPLDCVVAGRKIAEAGHGADSGVYGAYVKALEFYWDKLDFGDYCRILAERRIERGKLELLNLDLSVSETIAGLVELANDGIEAGGLRTYKDAANDYLGLLDRIAKGEEVSKTIPTGLNRLDALIRGLEEARLIVIAARPRIGKTAFLCALAAAVATRTTLPIPFFSLEMTEQQWIARMLSLQAPILSSRLRSARLSDVDKQRLTRVLTTDTGLLIDDTPAILPAYIRESLMRLTSPPAAVFVDYLQKMKSGGARYESRQIEVGDIARSLKNISKEFNIPVVVAAQINRAGADRPRIEHLRESGDIETEVDIIGLLGREDDEPEAGELQEINLFIDKNRDGSEGKIPMTFDPTITKFAELPHED